MKGAVSNPTSITGITIIVKRKDIPSPESKDGNKTVTTVKALVELGDYDTALKTFEEIRVAFVKIPSRAILNFYNAETNFYISLFTSGLEKPDNQSEKEFENALVETFRKINPNVVQVNVFPSGKFYVGRVYLKNEIDGRKFIVDYSAHLGLLAAHYKRAGEETARKIKFNINVDDKTMKKIKQFEKNVGQIQSIVKNEADRKRAIGNHNAPLKQQGGFPPIPMGFPHQGHMLPPHPKMMQMPNQPVYPMGNQMPMQMPGQMPGQAPPPHSNVPLGMPTPIMPMMNMGMRPMPSMGMGMSYQSSERSKIEGIYNQKIHYTEQAAKDQGFEQNFRKQLYAHAKFVVENDLKKTQLEAEVIAKKITDNNNVATIIEFLYKPLEMEKIVLRA